ncbi:hypothetical protein HY636_05085 [Candidatus Woesearchaeota archaeon]|nr:hypothetical protein [Candidatus Woesearchaeota archaeon]
MKKIIIVLVLSFLIIPFAFSIISTIESEGGYSTQATSGEFECYIIEVLPGSGIINLTIDLADQINPSGGRLLLWDNVTGNLEGNVTITGSGNLAVNINISSAAQTADGRVFIAAFAGSHAWTRVYKDPSNKPVTSNGINVHESAQPPSGDFGLANCRSAQFNLVNQHGLVLVDWTNISADTTPPSITYYNLTSSTNGCENWNTNKSNACNTSSVTPTVQFNTSKNAWCAVAGSSSSISLNLNYTDMGSSRNCTGAASGEGTREHFCTLTNQDELVYDASYLFISCKDSSNNQNRTSTSSALKLSITGLEASGRNSIGLGIQNALLSGYTNYTDLQIYARNLSNGQVKGTFDRAAKKGNKMWTFNRIGVSDSHVNMFNLTPVLYTLEFANTTSARITNLTELLINATK